MKKKQTKSVLKIKENWSKNLTLSSNELLQVGKGGDDGDPDCPTDPVAALGPKSNTTIISFFAGCPPK